ncbi:MAG: thiamine phosphate synthase [Acidobacteriota bacterium]|jgi:thiamine-phosphate diphosphorylase|nr:thiamine phosphate synthase [Acidobacteriota bacterium]
MTPLRYCRACGCELIERVLDGRLRKVCPECGQVAYENPIPATAAVVTDDSGRVLLVRRRVAPCPGEWCLPGGFLEVDETPMEGCLRELREETGLEGRIRSLISLEMGDRRAERSVLVAGFRVDDVHGCLRPGDDSAECRFFHFQQFPSLAFHSHQRILDQVIAPEPAAATLRPRLPRGAYVITSNDHLGVAEAACRAGAGVVQFRDKQMPRGKMLEIARKLRHLTQKMGAMLLVNDYLDLALMCGADGVHLGQEDVPLDAARRMLPQKMLVGVSTHSLSQARAAEAAGADYIGIGPVFATPTKADYPPIGLDVLRTVAATVSIPTVAIGGIDGLNFEQVKATGVSNIAMVRAFQEDPRGMVRRINAVLG